MFTIKEFLSINCIKEYKILSGEDNNTAIESISVIEIPLDDFIRKNELVLTTAIGCTDTEEDFYNFVSGIHKAGAASLVIGRKHSANTLPQKGLDFAILHNFPVVVIPWEYRFAEIVEEVLDQIRNDDISKIKKYEEIQRKLLSTYLEQKDLNIVAKILSIFFKLNVIITDEMLIVRGNNNNNMNKKTLEINDVTYIELEVSQRMYGYLCFDKLQNTSEVLSDMKYINRYIITPLTLWFNQESLINITKTKLKDDFIWKLANDITHLDDNTISQGRKLGFDLKASYLCMVARVFNNSGIEQEKFINENLDSIEGLIIKVCAEKNIKAMTTIHADLLILYIPNTIIENEKSLGQLIQVINYRIITAFPTLKISWGISETKSEDSNFCKRYQNAKLSLNLAFDGLNDTIGRFESTAIFRVISSFSSNLEICTMLTDIIKPICDYDLSKSSNLLETISTYINTNYNLCETARIIHLHRQSLIYRLNKIENLLKISLSNHDDLFLIEMCIRAYKCGILDSGGQSK